MNDIKRVFVEKKEAFAVEAKGLLADLRDNLGITVLESIRIVNRYDVMGLSDSEFAAATQQVLAEPPVDKVYLEQLPVHDDEHIFAVELLPGQYDQREDFAEQCIQLITQKERPTVASAKVYILKGHLGDEELLKIKAYCINPIEAREAELTKPLTLVNVCEEPENVQILTDFNELSSESLDALRNELGLAMSLDDLAWCQKYFFSAELDPQLLRLQKFFQKYRSAPQ